MALLTSQIASFHPSRLLFNWHCLILLWTIFSLCIVLGIHKRRCTLLASDVAETYKGQMQMHEGEVWSNYTEQTERMHHSSKEEGGDCASYPIYTELETTNYLKDERDLAGCMRKKAAATIFYNFFLSLKIVLILLFTSIFSSCTSANATLESSLPILGQHFACVSTLIILN